MQRTGNNSAAIVSKRVIPSHQIASIMQQHGWTPEILDHHTRPGDICHLDPKMLIVDIDDPEYNGIGILQWFRRHRPIAYTIALCQGGCSPAMRSARHLGVDGFFYLNASGLALDPERGLLPVFLQRRDIDSHGNSHTHRESRPPMAMPGRLATACSIGY